jgi:hypothetical protein
LRIVIELRRLDDGPVSKPLVASGFSRTIGV